MVTAGEKKVPALRGTLAPDGVHNRYGEVGQVLVGRLLSRERRLKSVTGNAC
jgi:hypothetical protein